MKSIIGVMPLWDDDKDSIWMLPGYLDGITQAGGLPIIFPLTCDEEELDQLLDMVDGVLFTGGHDVTPGIYGEEPLDNVCCCPSRDKQELYVLKKCIELDKSVLGICRGIQFINAALGGSLYQDLPTQHSSNVEHHQQPPYDVPSHEVNIIEETPLYHLFGQSVIRVNSYHHQAVKELAKELTAMSVSEDGLVEAIYRPESRFIWAVQWHPEFSYQVNENSQKIFKAFIDSTNKSVESL